MNSIPDMEKPSGQSEAYDLTYFDGHKRRVYVTDDQFYLTNTMMIFSRTDTKGFITSVNLPFIEASGWEKEELIGQPHYILRHPHMPASAFEDLWSTLQAGKQWTGCVKNLRKDGRYYWVYATAAPIISNGMFVGSTSVRRKIDDKTIAQYEAQYREMRKHEELFGFEPEEEKAAAGVGLLGKLFAKKK